MHPSSRLALALGAFALAAGHASAQIGSEKAVSRHLSDPDLVTMRLDELFQQGKLLFEARWTVQEGGLRPFTKGTGAALSDPSAPLVFPRNMNRISAPDANSCAGCHNVPFSGGGGDFVANVFVLGQRFDFATFSSVLDGFLTKGTTLENGSHANLQNVANSRNTLGMFGAGYIEMLARQITADLQAIRDGMSNGTSATLTSKGISFGTLTRNGDGTWDVSAVEGLPAKSLQTSGQTPPSLVIRPFHQAGAVVSLREFSNNAFNHHHGIQTTERFGVGTDADGDTFANEMTTADVTAVSVYQAALQPPGRVIPRDPAVEQAVLLGEQRFVDVGCASCHIPCLPLTGDGNIFSEPNPYNPAGNLQPNQGHDYAFDLNDKRLPGRRLAADQTGVTWVPCFTDFKLHDICAGPNDPNIEPLDMQVPASSPAFFAGNRKFLTRKLWGTANEPPYFHHGQYTTLRESVEAHAGEAATVMASYRALPQAEQDAIIEFLKTLQVLPEKAKGLIVDERGKKKAWPAFPYDCSRHLPGQSTAR